MAEVAAPPATPVAPNCVDDITAWVSEVLDAGRRPRCYLARIHRQHRRKLVLEFEMSGVKGSESAARQCIAKTYADGRGKRVYQIQTRLWDAGFRPPARFAVVRPIAYWDEWRCFLQGKAPGRQVAEFLYSGQEAASKAVSSAARWVAALQVSGIGAEARLAEIAAAVDRYGADLSVALPIHAGSLKRVTQRMLDGLDAARYAPLVPAHGDFHPKNVFIDADGSATAIDLDTFGLQEPAADVAYFLAQCAIMGYFHLGAFDATAHCRGEFLKTYEAATTAVPRQRLALYLGMAFLQSLHYELCVLRNRRTGIVPTWVRTCEGCVLEKEIRLRE